MTDSTNRGPDFDLGTSPHGLSAGLELPYQETPDAASSSPPAKPLLTAPTVYSSDKVQSACRTIERAAAKLNSGFFGVSLTQEQYKHLAFALLCQVEGLVESDEVDEPEVQDALRHLQAVQRTFKRAANAHASKVGNAKGANAWRKENTAFFDKGADS